MGIAYDHLFLIDMVAPSATSQKPTASTKDILLDFMASGTSLFLFLISIFLTLYLTSFFIYHVYPTFRLII